jgi:DNA-binding NtrC family response regulator
MSLTGAKRTYDWATFGRPEKTLNRPFPHGQARLARIIPNPIHPRRSMSGGGTVKTAGFPWHPPASPGCRTVRRLARREASRQVRVRDTMCMRRRIAARVASANLFCYIGRAIHSSRSWIRGDFLTIARRWLRRVPATLGNTGQHDFGVGAMSLERASTGSEQNAELVGDSTLAGSATADPNLTFIGDDPQIREVFQLISLVADTNATVLISGETGTGKELIAREIFRRSSRCQRPFVAVNCAAVPESLQEATMFGHVRGAFTGANETMVGCFEAAHAGTIFLDEVSAMDKALQIKLLRVLQSGEYIPVGSARARTCDVRVLAASNQNLREMVNRGEFRDDLFYRLSIICLQLPALRQRRGDLPLLVEHFLSRFRLAYRKADLTLDPRAASVLFHYDFPGNVRELENIMLRAVILCQGPRIMVEHLPREIREATSVTSEQPDRFHEAKARAIETFERAYLIAALSQCGGLVNRAARRVGLSERNFHAKLKKYGLSGRTFRDGPEASVASVAPVG